MSPASCFSSCADRAWETQRETFRFHGGGFGGTKNFTAKGVTKETSRWSFRVVEIRTYRGKKAHKKLEVYEALIDRFTDRAIQCNGFGVQVVAIYIIYNTTPKFNIEPEKWWFPTGISFSRDFFSGSMLNFWGVHPQKTLTWVSENHPHSWKSKLLLGPTSNFLIFMAQGCVFLFVVLCMPKNPGYSP